MPADVERMMTEGVVVDTIVTHEMMHHNQVAWNLVNDSLRTTICLRFKPKMVTDNRIKHNLLMEYLGS